MALGQVPGRLRCRSGRFHHQGRVQVQSRYRKAGWAEGIARGPLFQEETSGGQRYVFGLITTSSSRSRRPMLAELQHWLCSDQALLRCLEGSSGGSAQITEVFVEKQKIDACRAPALALLRSRRLRREAQNRCLQGASSSGFDGRNTDLSSMSFKMASLPRPSSTRRC